MCTVSAPIASDGVVILFQIPCFWNWWKRRQTVFSPRPSVINSRTYRLSCLPLKLKAKRIKIAVVSLCVLQCVCTNACVSRGTAPALPFNPLITTMSFYDVQVFPMSKRKRSASSSSSSSSDGQNEKCLLCFTVCVTVCVSLYHCVYCCMKLIVWNARRAALSMDLWWSILEFHINTVNKWQCCREVPRNECSCTFWASNDASNIDLRVIDRHNRWRLHI
jgi:hypothetical protein